MTLARKSLRLIQPDAESTTRAAQLLQSEYGRAAVEAYVQGWLGTAETCYSEDLPIQGDKDYVMSLLAILGSKSPSASYTIKELGGAFIENGYSIPQMQICRKEKKQ